MPDENWEAELMRISRRYLDEWVTKHPTSGGMKCPICQQKQWLSPSPIS